MSERPLGRLEPTDFEHVERYPLSALDAPPVEVPVVIGVNWYSNFDKPVRDGRHWWIGRGDLGRRRGGHAVVLPPFGLREPYSWWTWYDQVSEGICVAEAVSRCMSLLNRRRYQPRPLYDEAQRIDEWPGEDYSGTSVRAGLDVARMQGLVPALAGEPHFVHSVIDREFEPEHGIIANRWALTVDEVLVTLGADGRDYVELANSWGRDYPRRVRMPADTLDRLRHEHGELGIVTDK